MQRVWVRRRSWPRPNLGRDPIAARPGAPAAPCSSSAAEGRPASAVGQCPALQVCAERGREFPPGLWSLSRPSLNRPDLPVPCGALRSEHRNTDCSNPTARDAFVQSSPDAIQSLYDLHVLLLVLATELASARAMRQRGNPLLLSVAESPCEQDARRASQTDPP